MEGIPASDLWDEILNVMCPKPQPEAPSCVGRPKPDIDYVPPNVPRSQGRAKLVVSEYNDAVTQMSVKGRSPNMRHVNRIHRIALDWLVERCRHDPSLSTKFVGADKMTADILTKGSFSSVHWLSLCELINIGPSHSYLKRASPTNNGGSTGRPVQEPMKQEGTRGVK